MLKKIFLLLGVSAVPALAQLYIDNAGPRDILFAAPNGYANNQPWKVKFDSTDKSATATYFVRQANGPAGGQILQAISAKLSAPNGIEDVLSHGATPGTEVSVLTNWTKSLPPKEGRGRTVFANLRGSFRRDSLPLADAAGKVTDMSFDGGGVQLASGLLLRGNFGFAASVGYERRNNYQDLPEVTIGQSTSADGVVAGKTKTARQGVFRTIDAMPGSFTVIYDLPGKFADGAALFLPGIEKKDAGTYGLIVAAYVTADLSHFDESKAVGLSLTVRRWEGAAKSGSKTDPQPAAKPDFDSVQKEKVSFPLSVFVERRRPAGAREYETKAGVATVFTWGK